MKILVTGTEGYLGSLLAPILIKQGHDLLAVDTGFYKSGWLYNGTPVTARTLNKDIREITTDDLAGVEAVVHMAELSNDPTGELAPHITYEINHKGSVRLAELAKRAGVERFVYMSSCSVYGLAAEGFVSEESPVNPQTAYAICKTLVERDLRPMADDSFSPTFMRNATAYGASPRMRFDIVLNNLAGLAWTTKEIKMVSDGTPWRPLVHALDIARAIVCALAAPREAIHNETFNVGETTHNYTIREVAEVVAEVFPGCQLSFGQQGADNRSYRVSFDKIKTRLPGFKCDWDARRGAQQLHDVFQQVDLTLDLFGGRGFTRLKQLEYLIRTRQIDQDFFLDYERKVTFNETPLKGAFLIDLESCTDARGFFARTFCRREFEAHGLNPAVAQCNLSFNLKAGTVRGMHFQKSPASEAKLVRCVRGAVHDVIVDLRPQSATFRRHFAIELNADNRRALYIPESFAHGFQSLVDETEVEYQMSEFYQPEHGRGFRYDDPAFGIHWPLPVAVVSEQDLAWPVFS